MPKHLLSIQSCTPQLQESEFKTSSLSSLIKYCFNETRHTNSSQQNSFWDPPEHLLCSPTARENKGPVQPHSPYAFLMISQLIQTSISFLNPFTYHQSIACQVMHATEKKNTKMTVHGAFTA